MQPLSYLPDILRDLLLCVASDYPSADFDNLDYHSEE